MEYLIRFVGFLFFLDLLAYLPLQKQVFGRHRLPLMGLWLASCLALMSGHPALAFVGTGGLWALFRSLYINARWDNIRRGGGAPGFMSHWTALFLLIVQASAFLDASGQLSQRALELMRYDFAWIMICAGVYKVAIGYLKDDGMEYGRANPFWGYHWRRYQQSNPFSFHVRLLNWLGSLVEIVAGVLMLVPVFWVQALAALSITLGFVYVAAFIRLGRLAFLMMALPAIFVVSPPTVDMHLVTPTWMLRAFELLMLGYMVLLPAVKFVQYYNLFAKRSLPQPLQGWFTAYANLIPIIIWRVFTPDVTNFFVRIYTEDGQPLVHEDSTYSYSLNTWFPLSWKLRFLHVTESITLVSVFTTLKYFPSRPDLFEEKLLTYSDSLQGSWPQPLNKLRFEYVAIRKMEACFEFVPVTSYWVDRQKRQVTRQELVAGFDPSAPSRFSPCSETERPGSYVAR